LRLSGPGLGLVVVFGLVECAVFGGWLLVLIVCHFSGVFGDEKCTGALGETRFGDLWK